ncbi:MAG: flagellar filament capping protein FliD [Methylobacter sp.]|nr:flagellar filament capping protein FliD [Methylobacter sp.]
MASITSTGLGSGLDVESLVRGLVSAEGSATSQRLQIKEAKLQADLSALGTLKGALSAFQSSVQGLKDISAFKARTATSSSPTSFTVAANSTATAGSFSIVVDQLAVAAKVRTLAAPTTTVASGAYTVATQAAGTTTTDTVWNLKVDGLVLSTKTTAAGTTGASTDVSKTAAQLDTDLAAFLQVHPEYSATGTFDAPGNNVQITKADGSAVLIEQAVTGGTGGGAIAQAAFAGAGFEGTTAGFAFASDAALVGAGSLDINLGATHFNITTSSATTLAGLRDLINQSTTNPGISASIVKVSDTNSQLVLTSTVTGAANTIGVVATPTDALPPTGSLTRLASANLTPVQVAKDSIIHLDGQSITRTSNSLTDVISGVTIALVKEDPAAAAATLTIAVDKSSATSKVNDFIKAYNTLSGTLKTLSNYDAKTGKASRLFGDATLRGVQNQLRHVLSSSVAGGVAGASTLADIGIKTDKTGVLVLDSVKLDKAIAANSDAVPQLFASTNGLSPSFDKILTTYLATDGPLTARVDGINKNIGGITDERSKLSLRLTAIEARYRKQFTAMDNLLGKLKSTGNYLTQQLTPAQKTG